jgi:hypothetical protein
MVSWKLCGSTAEQRHVVKLVFADLSRLHVDKHCVRLRGDASHLVTLDNAAFEAGADDDTHGYYLNPTPRSHVIALRPYLKGSQLYTVLAHELGHYYGLSHRPRGLMAIATLKSTLPGLSTPSARLRQRIMKQLTTLLLHNQLKMLDQQ